MANQTSTYSGGIATAYGAALRGGYTGTYAEFCAQQAQYAENAAAVAQAKEDAQAAAAAAGQQAAAASGSATAAAGSAGDAAGSATAAAGSATAAAGSATAAGQAQTAAEAAQGAAEDAADDAETAAASVAGKTAQIDQNTADISQLKSQLAYTVYGILPNKPLEWNESGYYRVATNAKVESNDYVLSVPIFVSAEQTVYVYSSGATDVYKVLVYLKNGNIDFSSSIPGSNTINLEAVYTAGNDVAYIRICSKIEQKDFADVCTEQYQHIGDELDDLYLFNDVSKILFLSNGSYNNTYKRVNYVSNKGLITKYFIPLRSIYAFGITSASYSFTATFFDGSYTQVGNVYTSQYDSIIKLRDHVTALQYPSGAKYVRIVLNKENSQQAVFAETGFWVCSTDCLSEQDKYQNLISFIPANWDKDTLKDAVTVSEPNVEKMAHTSHIYEGDDGYLYVPYFANYDNQQEQIGANIKAKISKVSECDLHDKTTVVLIECGQDLGGFVQSSSYAPYDSFLISKSSDVFSYVFVATPENGVPSIGYADLTKSTLALGDAAISNFKYTLNGNTVTVPMNITNLSTFIDELLGSSGHTIGTYPILSTPVKYGNDYYAYLGGLQSTNGFAGCLVKTSDYGATWEFVAYNADFTDKIVCMWEGDIGISSDGKVFCSLRAVFHGEPYGTGYYNNETVVVYDLVNTVWGDFKILTGSVDGVNVQPSFNKYMNVSTGNYNNITYDTSRTFVYIKDDYVYFFYNINPKYATVWKTSGITRSTMMIVKFDKSLNFVSRKIYQCDAGVHYMMFINSKGRGYFSFTDDKRHLDSNVKGDIAVLITKEDFLP